MSGGGGGQRAGTGGPRWPVASRCSPVLFVGSGPSLSAFSSPSPLGSDTGETAAELEGRARRELGLSGRRLASAAPGDPSLVVLPGEPQSRSPDSASHLTTVSCHCRQPIPCPGLSLCHLSAGEEVMYPVQEQVLSGEQVSLPAVRVWAWGEAGLAGSLMGGQVLTPSLSSSSSCHHPRCRALMKPVLPPSSHYPSR